MSVLKGFQDPEIRYPKKDIPPVLDVYAAGRGQGSPPRSRPVFCLAHAGPSMSPSLRELELLEIAPYGARPVKIGDVVAVLPPGHKTHIVHRVIRVGADGVSTRGDNNAAEDPWRLQPSQIAGRVVAAWRGQRRRKVSGGLLGRLIARLVGARRTLNRVLSPIYTLLAQGGIVRRIVPSSSGPRIVGFQSNGHVRLRLQLHGRLIGEYDPKAGEWRIRRPFKLLIDKDKLPYQRDMASKRS